MLLVYLHSPGRGVSTDTHTILERISPSLEGSGQQIQAKASTDDIQAIEDILSEISDIR